ncbi:MAG TPA: VOC family protein [Pyrinomonadaceae bacterium]|nr:VOC family protein [Pyrinomonadaceae bacterium]
MINRTKLISVWVSDQDKAYDFYVNKLGFEVHTDQTMPNGFRWLEVVPPGGETHLAIAKPSPGQPDVQIGGFRGIGFDADDVQATYDELVAKGVNFTAPLAKQPWGGMMAQFADPDGNIFMLGG